MKSSVKPFAPKSLQDYFNFLLRQPKGFVFYDERSQAAKQEPNKAAALAALNQRYIDCMACPLGRQGRTQVVFGKGNPKAALMFIGEGPGRDEDIRGEPFVGRAGQLLAQIITAMQLTREDVYISNVVKCRPPNNRTPLPDESNTCTQLLLFEEIRIIKPRIVCTLGSIATCALLGERATISSSRGIPQVVNDITIMPTYHPAYLLRNPEAKKMVWEDMKKIMQLLKKFS